jgi:hypothetical protein
MKKLLIVSVVALLSFTAEAASAKAKLNDEMLGYVLEHCKKIKLALFEMAATKGSPQYERLKEWEDMIIRLELDIVHNKDLFH